ncbi:AAA family ATPase [Candidatus Bipolaricaulota sp. J31]
MEAPFKVGGAVEPPYFVGRGEDLDVLARSARNLDQHYLILAPRRFGKTSLLLNLRHRLEGERSLLVPYVNCRDMAGPEDLYRLLVRALLHELEHKGGLKGLWRKFRTVFGEKVLGAIRALEEIGGEVGEWGRVYLRFREREIDEGELVRAAFSFPGRIAAEHRVGVVFLLDEFQEVAEFDGHIFSVLKAAMDRASSVRYFFSGSSLGLIRDIFLKEESPLYLMVTKYRLGPLPRREALEFLSERFAMGGMDARPEALEGMYELTGGIPFYLQKLGLTVFSQLLFDGKTTVTKAAVKRAFGEMLGELDGEFEGRWLSEFSPLQRRILRALAELGQAGVTEVAKCLRAKPSDLSSSLTRLREAMVIERSDEGYHIIDTVFARWLTQA